MIELTSAFSIKAAAAPIARQWQGETQGIIFKIAYVYPLACINREPRWLQALKELLAEWEWLEFMGSESDA